MDEEKVQIRHERSKKDFPNLKLEADEYVEFAFRRAKSYLMLQMMALMSGAAVLLVVFLAALLGAGQLDAMGRNFMFILLGVLVLAAVIAGYIIMTVYNGNRLFVTNKHVIQMSMSSPLASSVNMIDLPSIEDASFSQNGVMAKLFRYGTFRLSTIGDETTYTFEYSDVSGTDLKAVSKLVVEAKRQLRQQEENKK